MKIYIDAVNLFLKIMLIGLIYQLTTNKSKKVIDIQKVFMIVPLESIVISILTHPSNLSHDLVLEQ